MKPIDFLQKKQRNNSDCSNCLDPHLSLIEESFSAKFKSLKLACALSFVYGIGNQFFLYKKDGLRDSLFS